MSSAEGYSAPKDPLIGQVVQERYRIMHAIGKGAMGMVYEAQHLLIGRKVALKTMAVHAVSPLGVQRFRREAQAAAAVGSSHVVDVLDMGRLDDGSLYIVMEHLDGVDLGFAVALEQRFTVGRAIHVMIQLCDALAAIHAAGIIHRDLKPENIFLTSRDGVPDFVKVLDFGVCKFHDAEGGRLTATGDAVGTPLFMAPEQVEGRSDCDQRADIYALGAILYYVLTGRAPFEAPNMPALFLRICKEPPPSLASTDSDLSFEMDAIIQRALSKDRDARFDSCGAFKAALRSLRTTPDEVAATLPGAIDASRVTEYAWSGVAGNGSTALIRTQPPRRVGGRGGAIGVGVLAASLASAAYLAGTHGAQLRVAAPNAPALANEVVPASDVPPPPRLLATPLPEQVITAAEPREVGKSKPRAVRTLPPSKLAVAQPALVPSAPPAPELTSQSGKAPKPAPSSSASTARFPLNGSLKRDL